MRGRRFMAEYDRQIEAALEKGRAARSTEPRAAKAWFDKKDGRIYVELENGVILSFLPDAAEGLEKASANDLQNVEVLGNGHALHWETLDVDFSVPNLVNGLFGTSRWMAARAGASKSVRKAAAARANGAKGGRPRKSQEIVPDKRLSAIVGSAPLPSSEIVSKVWDHIRKNNLRNPQNKREILTDDKLLKVFGKERITMFEMNQQLSELLQEESPRRDVRSTQKKKRA